MLGEELMILNPVGRRRRSHRRSRPRMRRRARARVRVQVTVPRRKRGRSRRRTRSRSRRRSMSVLLNRIRRGRGRRTRRNPVGKGLGAFRPGNVLKQAFSGIVGAAYGAGGLYLSKWILPAEYDRHPAGYAVHGLAGTAAAILTSPILRRVAGKNALGIALTGVWSTVFFRIAMNHILSKAARPAPVIPPSEKAKVAGLMGIEEHMPVGFDFGQEDWDPELSQAYQSPEPYDIGNERSRFIGQEYQPARSLPAATMPVNGLGQAYQSPEPYDIGDTGVYSKRPVTHFTAVW